MPVVHAGRTVGDTLTQNRSAVCESASAPTPHDQLVDLAFYFLEHSTHAVRFPGLALTCKVLFDSTCDCRCNWCQTPMVQSPSSLFRRNPLPPAVGFGQAVGNPLREFMTRLAIIFTSVLILGSIGALVGVALAQQASWVRPLAEEYSLVYKTAYDEAGEHDLVSAGREVVAEQVLYAYIATRSHSSVSSASPTPGGQSGPGGQPVPGTSPAPGITPTPGISPTPDITPTPTAESPSTITASDVDGYHSQFRVEIFVSSIGVNLAMSRVNTYTSNRATVKLTSDGTLTTGIGGTPLRDRYSWACNPVNGSTGESRSYANNEHGVSLPSTDLSNAPLLASSMGQRVNRICSGDESAPSSTVRTQWGQFFSF